MDISASSVRPTTVRPTWFNPRTARHAGLLAERPVQGSVTISKLTFVFNASHPQYGAALTEKRLYLRLADEGRFLELMERVAGDNISLRRAAISDQGDLQLVDGSVNFYQTRRLKAEEVFAGLGPVPALKHRKAALPPPPDLWVLPEMELRPTVAGDNNKVGYVIRQASESRYDADQLKVFHEGAKLIVAAGSECLGVVPDFNANNERQPIDLAKEVPALNYGPHYEAMIERTLAAHDEKKEELQLAELLLNQGAVYRRSFKPLELFARDYFKRGALIFPTTLKLIRLLVEGTGLIEQDGWYTADEKDMLLTEPSFIPVQKMAIPELKELSADTIKLALRLGRRFGDRQFAVVETIWQALAKKSVLVFTPKDALAIRREHYSVGRG